MVVLWGVAASSERGPPAKLTSTEVPHERGTLVELKERVDVNCAEEDAPPS